jgi:hypothetical protein
MLDVSRETVLLAARARRRRLYDASRTASRKSCAFHRAATALHFAHYNLVRRHQTTRVTPAMAAGVTDEMWGMDYLLGAALEPE